MESSFAQNRSNNAQFTGQDLIYSILPLLKLICLTGIGLILVHPKTQLVPKATFKILSKLVFALFLPCIIIVNLGEALTINNFIQWWFIPVNVILSTAIGCVLGWLVAKICRPPLEYVRFTIIMTAFGNMGNLPLAIVGSVCHSTGNPFGPACEITGTAYVSFGQWVSLVLVYTLVYHMMEPPLEYYEVIENGTEIQEQVSSNNLSRPLLVEAEWPGMEDRETENCKTPLIARVFRNASITSAISIPEPDLLEEGSSSRDPESPKSLRCLAEPRVVRRIRIVAEKTPILNILQPPAFATLLAFVVGMVPPLKSVAFGVDAPLSFITDSLEILAGAVVPSVMLVLGGMLSEGPNESSLGIQTTVGIIVARLFVLPLVGIGVVSLANSLNFLPGDQMFWFVVLLQYTTPSAILLGAVASLRGYAVREASALLFWQHIIAIFSLAIYIIIYFRMLHSNVKSVF